MSLKKTTSQATPHARFVNGSWTWLVLKVYQNPKAEKANQYARWFCAVSSPMTYGGCDMGDTYVRDVLDYATLVECTPEFAAHMAARA